MVIKYSSTEEALRESNKVLYNLITEMNKELGVLKADNKRLAKTIKKLELENKQLSAKVVALQDRYSRLEKENEDLRNENHELKVKLGTTSNNSSLPPSTDIFISPKQRSLRKKSTKNIGG
jgi:septal ring factor EnvC (AmiA/AmiB activator)